MDIDLIGPGEEDVLLLCPGREEGYNTESCFAKLCVCMCVCVCVCVCGGGGV